MSIKEIAVVRPKQVPAVTLEAELVPDQNFVRVTFSASIEEISKSSKISSDWVCKELSKAALRLASKLTGLPVSKLEIALWHECYDNVCVVPKDDSIVLVEV